MELAYKEQKVSNSYNAACIITRTQEKKTISVLVQDSTLSFYCNETGKYIFCYNVDEYVVQIENYIYKTDVYLVCLLRLSKVVIYRLLEKEDKLEQVGFKYFNRQQFFLNETFHFILTERNDGTYGTLKLSNHFMCTFPTNKKQRQGVVFRLFPDSGEIIDFCELRGFALPTLGFVEKVKDRYALKIKSYDADRVYNISEKSIPKAHRLFRYHQAAVLIHKNSMTYISNNTSFKVYFGVDEACDCYIKTYINFENAAICCHNDVIYVYDNETSAFFNIFIAFSKNTVKECFLEIIPLTSLLGLAHPDADFSTFDKIIVSERHLILLSKKTDTIIMGYTTVYKELERIKDEFYGDTIITIPSNTYVIVDVFRNVYIRSMCNVGNGLFLGVNETKLRGRLYEIFYKIPLICRTIYKLRGFKRFFDCSEFICLTNERETYILNLLGQDENGIDTFTIPEKFNLSERSIGMFKLSEGYMQITVNGVYYLCSSSMNALFHKSDVEISNAGMCAGYVYIVQENRICKIIVRESFIEVVTFVENVCSASLNNVLSYCTKNLIYLYLGDNGLPKIHSFGLEIKDYTVYARDEDAIFVIRDRENTVNIYSSSGKKMIMFKSPVTAQFDQLSTVLDNGDIIIFSSPPIYMHQIEKSGEFVFHRLKESFTDIDSTYYLDRSSLVAYKMVEGLNLDYLVAYRSYELDVIPTFICNADDHNCFVISSHTLEDGSQSLSTAETPLEADEQQKYKINNVLYRKQCHSLTLLNAEYQVVDQYSFEKNIYINDLKYLKLSDTQHVKGFIVCSTMYVGEENEHCIGYISVFEIVNVVQNADMPWADKKLRLFAKEKFKGPVVSCAAVRYNIALIISTRLFVYEVNRNEGLVAIAFSDMQTLSTSIDVVKNYILVSDINNGIFLFYFQSKPFKIYALGNSGKIEKCIFCKFVSFIDTNRSSELYMLGFSNSGILHAYSYSPYNVLSNGGKVLIKRYEVETQSSPYSFSVGQDIFCNGYKFAKLDIISSGFGISGCHKLVAGLGSNRSTCRPLKEITIREISEGQSL